MHSLPWHRLQWSPDLPEAFVLLGYAFYVQPMLMPLLHEMPPGQLGVRLMTTAVRYVTLGAPSWQAPRTACDLLHALMSMLLLPSSCSSAFGRTVSVFPSSPRLLPERPS